MASRCLMCSSDSPQAYKGLNTRTVVQIDGIEYNVCLCDEHANSATMAQIRGQIIAMRNKLKEVIKLAREIGIYEDDKQSVVIQPQPIRQPAQKIVQNDAEQEQQTKGDLTTLPNSTITPEERDESTISVNKNTGVQHVSDKTVNKVVDMQQVVGRGGKPTVIPKRMVGDFGTTEIRIVKTDDSVIQKRLRALVCGGDSGAKCHQCNGSGIDSDGNVCKECGA